MKILVTSATDHRIDVQFVGWMCKALKELNIETTLNVGDTYDKAIIFNGVLDTESMHKIDYINHKCPGNVYYMYDDCDLAIPPDVNVLSQFNNKYGNYFPISTLAIMSKYWDKPIVKNKVYSTFYGGTFKSRRDYSIIPNVKSTLLVGDDKRWDKFDNTTRLPTIRDMELVYHIMATCSNTLIVSDPMHNDINVPLRAFECVFTSCHLYTYKGEMFSADELRSRLYRKNLLLNAIEKEIINGN